MPAVMKTFTLPSGESIDLFYIGTLASALGRTTGAIRKWEIGGLIPETPFRDRDNRRLYSQEQIDTIVRCAERAKILQGKNISTTSFKKWCHSELELLKQKYMGGK